MRTCETAKYSLQVMKKTMLCKEIINYLNFQLKQKYFADLINQQRFPGSWLVDRRGKNS